MKDLDFKSFLDEKAAQYHHPDFITGDPISVPHAFSLPQDIEISGLFAALFAWGQRSTTIQKARHLMALMDDAPYAFVCGYQPSDLKPLYSFKHRTISGDDLMYLLHALQQHYRDYPSLEDAFVAGMQPQDDTVEAGLNGFRRYLFQWEHLPRTRKHISAPETGSSCKRLNMYLRWMVRPAAGGVDFGLWHRIAPAQLVCPLDVHVVRVAKRFGLLTRKQSDWMAALELTKNLRHLRPEDPIWYDYALFGLGIMEKY
jgi:uncharacterized protein (TIGR02757 family)